MRLTRVLVATTDHVGLVGVGIAFLVLATAFMAFVVRSLRHDGARARRLTHMTLLVSSSGECSSSASIPPLLSRPRNAQH